MEYLVIAGGGLKESFSQTLGEYAPFFWGVVAPVGLALLWVLAIHSLWETWRNQGSEEQGRSGFFTKLLFSFVLVALILGSGTGLEYLLLGGGLFHARVLGGVLGLVGIQ
jgi:hypothetical protein